MSILQLKKSFHSDIYVLGSWMSKVHNHNSFNATFGKLSCTLTNRNK